jgi:hypothetical protein
VGGPAPAGPLANTQRFEFCLAPRVALLIGQGAAPDDAVRQANLACGVPHIRARPLEAARLLSQASALLGGPLDVEALLAEGRALVSGPPFEVGSPNPANFRLGAQLLAQARDLLAASPAGTDQLRQLLGGATSLLPDPLDPGPDPTKPFGPPLRPDERVAVRGAFKAPGLRNVELTAPYFHNGGQATLDQVVEFYDRGGDFHAANDPDADTDVAPIGLTDRQQAELVAFLKALTDERVRWERAPFDHPSLSVPNGAAAGSPRLLLAGIPVLEDRVVLPAVGAAGSAIPLGTPGTPFANFPDPLWAELAVGAGDRQSGRAGVALHAPLVVVVRDDAGVPVPGVAVRFEAPPGGVVSPAVAVTGVDGTASAVATLADGPAAQVFTARRDGVDGAPVRFTAQASDATDTSGGCSAGAAGGPSLALAALGLWLAPSLRRRRTPTAAPRREGGSR